MNETVFREILGESLRREFAEFDNAPEHRFSLRHRRAMKRVFARYEKNTRRPIVLSAETMPYYSLKQKVVIALVIVILMTLITGAIIPLHRATDEQINLLRSRYDFPNMVLSITVFQADPLPPEDDMGAYVVGVTVKNEEYADFLSDLENMGIYTDEEVKALDRRMRPIDTRPYDPQNGTVYRDTPFDPDLNTPLEKAREFVSYLETQIEFYTERSKDEARAVEGDAEFAADIKKNYLDLHKSYLELLEKLYADPTDDNSLEDHYIALLIMDKDYRKYLVEINKFENH